MISAGADPIDRQQGCLELSPVVEDVEKEVVALDTQQPPPLGASSYRQGVVRSEPPGSELVPELGSSMTVADGGEVEVVDADVEMQGGISEERVPDTDMQGDSDSECKGGAKGWHGSVPQPWENEAAPIEASVPAQPQEVAFPHRGPHQLGPSEGKGAPETEGSKQAFCVSPAVQSQHAVPSTDHQMDVETVVEATGDGSSGPGAKQDRVQQVTQQLQSAVIHESPRPITSHNE